METDYTSSWFVESALATASCVGIAVNLLVIFIFMRKPGLRTVSNRFVLNLLITNLISSTVLIPLLLADEILKRSSTEESPIIPLIGNNAVCYISEGITSLVCTASILSILLIAIDQYFAVVHPLRYHTRIDQCKSAILIGTAWFLSIIIGILGGLTPTERGSLWNFCKNDGLIGSEYFRISYTISYFVLVILVPFVAIAVLYMCIYTAAHRNSERMRHTNSGSITINIETYVPVDDGLTLKLDDEYNSYKHSLETLAEVPVVSIQNWDQPIKKVCSVPSFGVEVTPVLPKSPSAEAIQNELLIPDFRRKTSDASTTLGIPKTRTNSLKSTSSFMNTLRYRISNASLFRYREETRAVKISVIVILLVLICYIPYGVALILHNFLNSRALQIFDSIALVHLVFSSVLSPFLFAYRNRRIKREIYKIFHPTKLDADLQRLKNRIRRNSSFNNVIKTEFLSPPLATENKSILKRVCDKTKMWNTGTKKCNFITVPDTECRSSFSSQNSTQLSTTSTDEN